MRLRRTWARRAQSHPAPPPSAEATLAEAERLARAKDLIGAVDTLARIDRQEPQPSTSTRLLSLRHEAATCYESGPGRDPWPPMYADPFPDVVGRAPEISAADLDTAVLGGAVAHHGCLVVRGLFDGEQVERTLGGIDKARTSEQEGAGDEWYQPLPAAPEKKNQALRKMVAAQGGIWLGDSPACADQVLRDLERSGAIPAIAEHFGERPFFSLQKSTLRRSLPKFFNVAWHQDGSFLTAGVRTMNVWVALSPCGGDHASPALEIIPRRIDEVLPVDGVMSPHSISYDLIDELAAVTPTTVPVFAPGDAMLFDERFVHRTHLTEAMSDVRYALECWFFAPSHHSSDYTPLLV